MNFTKVLRIIVGLTIFALITSCANRAAGPTGGPKDSIPPVIVRTLPLNGSVNYKKKEIQVYFDENINVEKPNENVIVSPPQLIPPVVKGNGKVLSLSLQDDLAPETSYSIVFNNAIVDLNERNPYPSFVFSFSTGNEIDTLRIQGTLTDAFNLNPVPNVMVGIHPADSVDGIFNSKFKRITKTDQEGRFSIGNVRKGAYHVYALNDINKDFRYQHGEQTAFLDTIVIPEVRLIEKTDTLRRDSLTGDTIISNKIIMYSPDNLLLRYFKDARKRQYIVKSERTDARKFQIYFNRPNDIKPEFRILNSSADSRVLYRYSAKNDTITAWLRNDKLIANDSLMLEVSYQKTDSLFNMYAGRDTVKIIYKPIAKNTTTSKKGKAENEIQQEKLELKTNFQNQTDPNAVLMVYLSEPADSVRIPGMGLFQKVDTVLQQQKFSMIPVDSVRSAWRINFSMKPGGTYEFRIDSAAISGIYGLTNDKFTQKFTVKSTDEFSTIKLVMQNPDSLYVVQVIDGKENVITQQRVKNKDIRFMYLKPGDYFLKLFVDKNMNDQWDSGILRDRIQPEEVIYFSKKLSLKANWEVEETWNPLEDFGKTIKPAELLSNQAKK